MKECPRVKPTRGAPQNRLSGLVLGHPSNPFGVRMRRANLEGLLLGHAVQGAEAEDQVAAGDADDFAVGE
jgi:hypothetical protein